MSSSKIPCRPCESDHISKDAKKWCTNCNEGFCKDCEKIHKATKMSKKHKLIGIEDYHKQSRISIIQTCEGHGKLFDSYCKTHDIILCPACVVSQHKLCEDIIPLENAANNVKTSTALIDLEDTISVVLKNIQSIIQHTNVSELDIQENNIKRYISEIRTKINNSLDEMEENLILELDSKLSKYRSNYEAVLKHMEDSEKSMIRLKEQTTEMKELASDLHFFVGMRQINKTVHEFFKSTSDLNVTSKYNVSFEIDPVLNSLLTKIIIFGNINTEVTNIPLSQPNIGQAQVTVHQMIKSVSDVGIELRQKFTIQKKRISMFITGCAILLDGQLLIADYKGKKQLMQHNQDGKHVRDIPVCREPFDVAVIDSELVAISYGNSGYIEIFNTKNMTVKTKIDFDSNTYGLSYQGGKLYVVVSGSGIVVIALSGEKLKTLKVNVDFVNYVTTTADRIYYSDFLTHTVTCCDKTGKQIWKFKDDSIVRPVGLTVLNNQNVVVIGCDSDNVTIISRDGQTSKTLLTESDGLHYPRTIYFSRDTGDILVCNERDTEAALFRVTY